MIATVWAVIQIILEAEKKQTWLDYESLEQEDLLIQITDGNSFISDFYQSFILIQN